MREWSKQQEEIFQWFSTAKPKGRGKKAKVNNLVVRARAGTGKTTTIIEGISRAADKRILLVAFNKSIATELQQRIVNPCAEAKTLHSLGFSFILNNIKVKVDNDRGLRLAQACLARNMPLGVALCVKKLASLAKNCCPELAEDDVVDLAYAFDCFPDPEINISQNEFIEATIKACNLALKDDGTVDFDDMIFVPVRMGWVTGKWNLVVVDECQDMNATQLLLAKGACKGRMCIVGDDRQAIYGFRGADSGAIDRLKAELQAEELGLTITYRCPQKIVAHAKTLVPDYECAPHAAEGEIAHLELKDLAEAAQPGDFVLSRKNAPLASACLSLIRAGKPAKISGKDIGKTLINLSKKWKDRGIVHFLEQLTKWEDAEIRKAHTYPEDKRQGKIITIQDQAETLRALSEGVSELSELRARIENLFVDDKQNPLNVVLCSSIHKAKGQERDTVYVFADTLYPGKGAHSKLEEINLEYVAVTRAKKKLVWVEGSY